VRLESGIGQRCHHKVTWSNLPSSKQHLPQRPPPINRTIQIRRKAPIPQHPPIQTSSLRCLDRHKPIPPLPHKLRNPRNHLQSSVRRHVHLKTLDLIRRPRTASPSHSTFSCTQCSSRHDKHRHSPNSTARRGKQADYGWGRRRRPHNQPKYPSITLEVAYSESEAMLNSDI
jgi:hypothetical protein